MEEFIFELKQLIEKYENRNKSNETIEYVDLTNGTLEEKMERIIAQAKEYKLNLLPTPQASNYVRGAIAAEFGENGLGYWLDLRRNREDYDEVAQIKKYNYQVARKSKNTMTFGAIVNRYRIAVEEHNNNSMKTNLQYEQNHKLQS